MFLGILEHKFIWTGQNCALLFNTVRLICLTGLLVRIAVIILRKEIKAMETSCSNTYVRLKNVQQIW